jgi:haloalkane dehalogenase
VTSWFESLDLRGVTLFVQDWGSLIGLRIAAEQSDRIARIVVANGFLPAGQRPANLSFRVWRAFARYSPVLPAGRIVEFGTVMAVPADVRAGYDAPFPNKNFSSRGPRVPAAGADVA